MCDIEELLEYPRRYDALYANSNERELYKMKKEPIPDEYIKNKFYYEVCSNVKWNPKKIYSLSLEFGKPIPYILNMANLYVINILHQGLLPEVLDLTKKYYSKVKSQNSIKSIFENLESLQDLGDIIKYLQNKKIEIQTLKEYLNEYLTLYKKDLNQIQLNDLKKI